MIDLGQYDARTAHKGEPTRKYRVSVWMDSDDREPSVQTVTYSAETIGRAHTRMTNLAIKKFPLYRKILVEVLED